MELLEIEHRLRHLLDNFGGGLPMDQLRDMKELINAGEPGVALENYCTQLLEYDISVPSSILVELKELGLAMGIDDKYWMRLPISTSPQRR